MPFEMLEIGLLLTAKLRHFRPIDVDEDKCGQQSA